MSGGIVPAARRRLAGLRERFDPDRRVTPAAAATVAQLLEPIRPTTNAVAGPRVVLLNDCRDQVNYGAEALIDGLLRLLRAQLPTATIVPIPSFWLIDPAHLDGFVKGGVGLVPPRVKYPIVADQFDAVADDWLAGNGGPGVDTVLERFAGADVVVLNGEGSIYRTNPSAIRELYLAWFAQARLGIPTVFVNGMVHLVDVQPVLPAMARRTFRTVRAVAVREPCSLRNAREWIPDVEILSFPDSAFAIEASDACDGAAVAEVRRRIDGAAYFCFDPGPMPMDTRPGGRSALHALLTTLEADSEARPVVVCSAPADAHVRRVADEIGALYVDTILDYREYMTLVRDAQFLISGRYHNPLLAAMVGCPTIAIASANHKVHGACETLDGVIGTPYDGTSLFTELPAIRAHARGYVDERDAWRERLLEISARRRAEVDGLGRLVREVAEGRR